MPTRAEMKLLATDIESQFTCWLAYSGSRLTGVRVSTGGGLP
jgi:hypothetical protein